MITIDIFQNQIDAALKDKARKKNPKYDVFFFLRESGHDAGGHEYETYSLRKINIYDDDTFFKYNISSTAREDLKYPILEEVKFFELILDLPDYNETVEWIFKPSGIIIEKLDKENKTVKTRTGTYHNVKRYKLLIPSTYIVKNLKTL